MRDQKPRKNTDPRKNCPRCGRPARFVAKTEEGGKDPSLSCPVTTMDHYACDACGHGWGV